MAGNTVFKLRRSSVAGKVPTTTDIAIGEMALNITDRLLYSSDGTNTWEIGSNNTIVRITNNATIASVTTANSLGIFTTQTVNATSYTTGTYGNTSTGGSVVNTTYIAVGNSSVNATVNSTYLTVGTSFIANTLGVYHTGVINAASHTTGDGGTSTSGGVTVNTTVIQIGNNTVNSSINAHSVNPDVGMSNKQTLDHNYTLSSGRNLVIGGPYTISTGYTLTIPTGSRMVVI